MTSSITKIIEKYKKDSTRLMDILIDIQEDEGYISKEAIKEISNELEISTVDVQQTISFYHFFTYKSPSKFCIYLNDSVVANMMGRQEVVKALEDATGCKFGLVSNDGLIGLYNTACIGMSDQEPSAIINGKVFTNLTPFRAKQIIHDIKDGKELEELQVEGNGDGKNGGELINSMVCNNIRKKGPILSENYNPYNIIKNILPKLAPEQVIDQVKASNIRGRGGAGFPTGLKWDFCRKAKADVKYIFCNADEGEPGTFKDRVILTERPRLLIEGMVIAAFAVGASHGILYIRYEYKYLEKHFENYLNEARKNNLLGKNIAGIKGFDFDIRVQFGAGAYVCGEESALIESAEGKRGEPRDRPPFPVEKGYLEKPTVVNNVETFCSIVKILTNGPDWYKTFGTHESSGTKVLSISGDCKYPGIYEVDWGFSVYNILEMVGADKDIQAVQIGGPSGTLLGPNEFRRVLGYEDLSTGGSLIIFNKDRDLLKDVVLNFTEFFIDESCGSCSTCRIMPVVLKDLVLKIINGHGVMQDVENLLEWSKVLKASRCGLGQTAANPIVSSVKNFRHLYESKVQKDIDFDAGFNMANAVEDYIQASGRKVSLN